MPEIRADEAAFEESKHPRDEDGKFSSASAHGVSGRTASSGEALPEHVTKLRIPPAWTDVRYSTDPDSPLQAVGRDAKGREQRIYSLSHAARQAEAKFSRVQALDREFRRITRANVEAQRDRDKADVADALALVMSTGIRPGSDSDTRAEEQAFGATTLEGRHVHQENGKVSLRFVGKKGDIPVAEARLAKMLVARAERAGSGGRLFPAASAGRLLSHVREIGGDFKTKDFRTLLGTRIADQAVRAVERPRTMTAYKRAVRQVAQQVAQKLGNTPTVALQSYIAPEVFSRWRAGLKDSGARADASEMLPGELHEDYRGPLADVLRTLCLAYPQVEPPRVEMFAEDYDRSLGHAETDGTIRLNSYWFSRPRSFFQRAVVRAREVSPEGAPKWHGGIGGEDNEFARFVAHEFGHLLADKVPGSAAFSKAGHAAAIDQPDLAVSGYALVDAEEWFSETFCGLRFGAASVQVAEMAKFLEEHK